MNLTLGSLFDGSGGFPLAGSLCGVTPLWAAEVEPYPIAVTRSRFPYMKHLGDVSKVNGWEIEPVDIITFGSPCQDLSVAGKRAGLKHEGKGDEETTRSGLFLEAIRIIKEMRSATNGKYPRFAIWENVPGAFSSSDKEDFRCVLQEFIQIVEPSATVPPAPKGGWPYADAYVGDGWSLAYRTFDAQYWGVPQRRRRIYLVADLTGGCAPGILFEREGLRGYFTKGRTPWEGAAGNAENGIGAADPAVGLDIYNLTETGGVAASLTTATGQGASNSGPSVAIPYTLKIRSGCEGGGKGALIQTDKSATLSTLNDQYLFQPIAFTQNQRDEVRDLHDKAGALAAEPGMKQQTFVAVPTIVDSHILDDQGGSQINVRTDGKSPTLRAEMHGNVPCVLEAAGFKGRAGAQAGSIGYQGETSPTLLAEMLPSVCIKTWDARGNGDGEIVSTITGDHEGHVSDYTSIICMAHGQANAEIMDNLSPCLNCNHEQPIACYPIHDQATRFSGKRGDKADGKGNGLGIGNEGDPMNTLTAGDRHAVCYGVDCRNFAEMPELYQTLQAKPNGGQSLNYSGAVRIEYIVRRLTPIECARLQGFADDWGEIDRKDDFTDEEYQFWLEVRNTHAAINGKTTKHYTKAQMLTWYNKLHVNSSEYKMWGNGIALPPTLYVMQGICDAAGKEDDNDHSRIEALER